jgi:hypothetical protein
MAVQSIAFLRRNVKLSVKYSTILKFVAVDRQFVLNRLNKMCSPLPRAYGGNLVGGRVWTKTLF